MNRIMDRLKGRGSRSRGGGWASSQGMMPGWGGRQGRGMQNDVVRMYNQMAEQLYVQTLAALGKTPLNERSGDIERMLYALADEAIASNLEAQSALNYLAELTQQMEQIGYQPQSRQTNEIQARIRQWVDDQEQFLLRLPQQRQGSRRDREMVGGVGF